MFIQSITAKSIAAIMIPPMRINLNDIAQLSSVEYAVLSSILVMILGVIPAAIEAEAFTRVV